VEAVVQPEQAERLEETRLPQLQRGHQLHLGVARQRLLVAEIRLRRLQARRRAVQAVERGLEQGLEEAVVVVECPLRRSTRRREGHIKPIHRKILRRPTACLRVCPVS